MRRETTYLSDSIETSPSSRARKYTFSIFYPHHERSGRSYPYHDYSDGQCTRQNEMQVITDVTQLDVLVRNYSEESASHTEKKKIVTAHRTA